MKPAFKVVADGADITAQIADRLLQLRVTDNAGQQSDSLEIGLDDRDAQVPLPAAGSWLRVWIGYSEGGPAPAYMGAFAVDECELSNGPRGMTIKATASNTAPRLVREQRTQSWHDTTLGQIVEEIAKRNGLQPVIKGDLAGTPIKHEDQTNESDQSFLTRLAEKYKAVIKPADGTLTMVPRGEGTASPAPAASGEQASFKIQQAEVTNWRATIKSRGAYGGVTARYLDRSDNKEKLVTAGEKDGALPVFEEKQLFRNKEEADAAAASRLQALRSGEVRISLTMPGRPDFNAEGLVTLSGFRPEVDGTWIVVTVTHDLSSSGYSTSVECGTQGEESNEWSTGGDSGSSGGGGAAGTTRGVIAKTGHTGDSTGPHLDIRWTDGRRITAADADRYIRINGRPPSSFGVTSGYGPRALFGRSFHAGMDFGTPSGSSITLINGARYVRNLGYTGAGGYAVEIATPQGNMRLLHLQAGSAR
jgi:phage protein D